MAEQTPSITDAAGFDLIAQLLAAPNPPVLAERVIASAVRLTRADGGALLLPEPDGSLVVRKAWSPDGKATTGRVFARGEGVAGWVAEHDEPVLLNAARQDPRFRALDEKGYVQALIAVPFPLDSRRGVITIYAARADAFTGDHLQALKRYALVAALIFSQATAHADLERERERLRLAQAMSRVVLSTVDYEAQVRAVCAAVARHLGFSRCSVGMVSDDGRRVRGVAGLGLPVSYIRASECPVADLPGDEIERAIGRAAKRGETVLCRDRGADAGYRASLEHPAPDKVYAAEYVCVPLRAHGETIGVLTVSPLAGEGHLTPDTVATLESFADLVALVILQARSEQATREAYREILASLAAIVESRDAYTAMHAENVLAYATALARQMGLSAGEVEGIQLGAILHDVGKVAIADMILKKPGALVGAERDEMQRHASIGGALLSSAYFLRAARAVVEHHHERWDGKGYPGGLQGDAIPLPAQIVAIADAYDAMTTDRPYREQLPGEEARRRLREAAGSQFAPELVEAFLQLLEQEKRSERYELAVEEKGRALCFTCSGDFTLDAGREILEAAGAWLKAERSDVVLDLTRVTTLTDPGAWMLLRLAARCAAQGGMLLVAGDEVMQERLSLRVVSPADAERFLAKRGI